MTLFLWLSAAFILLAWIIRQIVKAETERGKKATITDETIAKYRNPDGDTDLERFRKSMELSKAVCDRKP